MDSTAIAIIPVYLLVEGLTTGVAAGFVTVLQVGMIVAQPSLGSLLDRFSRWRIATHCLLLTAAGFAALAYIPLDGWLLWITAAMVGAAFFGTYTSAPSLLGQDHVSSTLTAESAAFAICYSLGGIVGPSATEYLMEIDPVIAFWVLAAVNIVAVAILRTRWTAVPRPVLDQRLFPETVGSKL